MLTLIHGDDIVASRRLLDEEKTKDKTQEVISLIGKGLTLTDLMTVTASPSLFAKEKTTIIENLLSRAKSSPVDTILKHLKDIPSESKVIFWEDRQLDKTTIKKYFAYSKVILCQLPALLFRFLDSVGSKPLPAVLSLFDQLSDYQEAEIILAMLIRQWRFLLIACDLGEKGFPGMPGWQSRKFISQSRFFISERLIASYRQLLSIDQKIKFGATPYNLRELLDIFLVSLYHEF